MARSYEYTRKRFYLMQVVMWVILLASVGVAALVSWDRKRPIKVRLGEPVSIGSMSLRLPVGWRMRQPEELEEGLVLVVREPVRSAWQRVITVVARPKATLLERLFVQSAGPGRSIPFGDASGVVASPRIEREVDPVRMTMSERVGITATGQLREGEQIEIHLSIPRFEEGGADENVALLKEIAATVKRVSSGPEIGPG